MGVAAASAVKETVTALSAGVGPAPARPALDAALLRAAPGGFAGALARVRG